MPLFLMEWVWMGVWEGITKCLYCTCIHIVSMQVARSRLLWCLLDTAIPCITHRLTPPKRSEFGTWENSAIQICYYSCSLTPVKPPALATPVLTHHNDTTSTCAHSPTPKNNSRFHSSEMHGDPDGQALTACSVWRTMPTHMFCVIDQAHSHVLCDRPSPLKCSVWRTMPTHMFCVKDQVHSHVLCKGPSLLMFCVKDQTHSSVNTKPIRMFCDRPSPLRCSVKDQAHSHVLLRTKPTQMFYVKDQAHSCYVRQTKLNHIFCVKDQTHSH